MAATSSLPSTLLTAAVMAYLVANSGMLGCSREFEYCDYLQYRITDVLSTSAHSEHTGSFGIFFSTCERTDSGVLKRESGARQCVTTAERLTTAIFKGDDHGCEE